MPSFSVGFIVLAYENAPSHMRNTD